MSSVTVAMSGGVDSSVAAWLVQQQYADISGVYMRTWHNDDAVYPIGACPWRQDAEDARKVATQLGISFKIVNMIDRYKEFVVDPLLAGYQNGRTPNPDILCNQFIKFDALQSVLDSGTMIATGHYARKRANSDGTVDIVVPEDREKDQTYFLAYLQQKQIQSAIFPLGDFIKKTEVRHYARELGLCTAAKKDSQGICFLGKVKIQHFLSHFIPNKPGDIIDNHGKVVGRHQGLHQFTIGQRHGLGIPSNSDGNFYVVTGKDLEHNILHVAFESEHKLYGKTYRIHHLSFTNRPLPERATIACRPRYRDPDQEILFERIGDDEAVITFKSEQRALAPGQVAAFYESGVLLGAGTYL
ncbi:MAG: tRNA 2-thiouridine(34) synthase MnmA [Opitutales bacterium]|nr:tRNA 2-thiouridine(34) synthase MnmA [Opitutales bacterium]